MSLQDIVTDANLHANLAPIWYYTLNERKWKRKLGT